MPRPVEEEAYKLIAEVAAKYNKKLADEQITRRYEIDNSLGYFAKKYPSINMTEWEKLEIKALALGSFKLDLYYYIRLGKLRVSYLLFLLTIYSQHGTDLFVSLVEHSSSLVLNSSFKDVLKLLINDPNNFQGGLLEMIKVTNKQVLMLEGIIDSKGDFIKLSYMNEVTKVDLAKAFRYGH